MRTLYELVKRDHPAIPFILFGHSMGSLLGARLCVARWGGLRRVHLLRHGRPAGGAGLCQVHRPARGAPRAGPPQQLLERLCFGGYNRAVGSSRTAFDWLSRDAAEVDRYVARSRLRLHVYGGRHARRIGRAAGRLRHGWASRVPDAPILLASGDCDPVGGRGGGGVRQAAGWLRQSGHGTVELKQYPGARHELLNETNRDEVYGDIALFIETVETMGAFA